MLELTLKFNNQNYVAKLNKETGFYEVEIKAPETGGIYKAEATFTDLFGEFYQAEKNIQVLIKETIKIHTDKIFMWIFNQDDFKIKDIVEISSYEINIDEETNATTIINVLKKTDAKANDIVVIKKNNCEIFWGIISQISNENGQIPYRFSLKYITNMFDTKVILKEDSEKQINEEGIEDFIASTIEDKFISNDDSMMNKSYLQIEVKTHTKKKTSVTNVENRIYNLHTWITNCTQNYDIVYNFSVRNKKLCMTIENKKAKKKIIDVKAHAISDYNEVFDTNIISKVTVLTSTEIYTLYLLIDRTTTTNMLDENRACGQEEIIYCEKYEEAKQAALNIIRSNSYNHNITFKFNEYIPVGTPIALGTKDSLVYDTYISAIKITQSKFYEYTCGNIRVNILDKLKKERRK